MKPVLLLLRHGETKLNAVDAFRGWKNVPLNQTGLKQARSAGGFLRRFPISLIIHSPLDRATETAKIVAQGKPIEADARLMPWNIGLLAGKPKDKFLPVRDYYLDHPNRAVPQGESINSFEKRFKEILDLALESKRLPLFVTHTSNIVAAGNLLMGDKGREEDTESVQPGGVAAVFKTAKGFVLQPVFRASKTEDEES